MRKIFTLVFALLLAMGLAYGQQNTLTPDYTTAAVTATSNVVPIHSASGITSGALTSGTVGSILFFPVSGEAMQVRSISGTNLTVTRGVMSTTPAAHISGEAVYYGAPNLFYNTDPSGTCTVGSTWVAPWINVQANRMWTCSAQTVGFWGLNAAGPYPASIKLVSTALTGSNVAYTALISDYIIESKMTLASNDGVVTLPNAARCPGKIYIIQDAYGSAGGSYHITLAADAINGGTTASCTASAYGACHLISTGASWFTF